MEFEDYMGKIYITGDCHADFHKFNTDLFPEQKELTHDDFVIVCGDFGGIWYDDKEERYWLEWLNNKPFTTLFVDGNHENFARLYTEFPAVDFYGGKAHQIRDNIYHLMRGYIFELCGKKIFAFGGASSHDIKDGILDRNDFNGDNTFFDMCRRWRKSEKMFRIKGISWWEQEMPSDEEMRFGFETLKRNDFKVDYVITHCLPQSIAAVFSSELYMPDKLTMYFDKLMDNGLLFRDWYCGHYHKKINVMTKFHVLYDDMIRIV